MDVFKVKAVVFSSIIKFTPQQLPRVLFLFLWPQQESFFQDIDLLQKHGIVSQQQGWNILRVFLIRSKVSFLCERLSVPPYLWPQNMADLKKMKSVGICTVKGIQMTTRKALCNIKGLSEAKVEKIKEAAGKMLVKWDFLLWISCHSSTGTTLLLVALKKKLAKYFMY